MTMPGVGLRGATVVETLVALLLGLVLAVLSLALLARQRSVQTAMSQRMDLVGTVRVVRHVLGAELRSEWDSEAPSVHGPDSVSLRAYRGVARVCEVREWNSVLVATQGVRLPDARKDSLLFLTSDGRQAARALLSVAGGESGWCGARPGRRMVLSVSDTVPRGVVLARFFERGSYHLSGRALRYRRGLAGRQPLTPEALSTPASTFAFSETGGVGVILEPRWSHGTAWVMTLRGGGW